MSGIKQPNITTNQILTLGILFITRVVLNNAHNAFVVIDPAWTYRCLVHNNNYVLCP